MFAVTAGCLRASCRCGGMVASFLCVCVGGAGYAGVLTVLGTVGNCREGWGVKRGRCNAF